MKAAIKNPMDEPFQQILSRLSKIEHKVESIDETNAFALRAEEAEHQKTVKKSSLADAERKFIWLPTELGESLRLRNTSACIHQTSARN